MIIVPAEKLAAAVDKWIKPGVIRHLSKSDEQKKDNQKVLKSS